MTCTLVTPWTQNHPRALSRTPGPRRPGGSLTLTASGDRDRGLLVMQRQIPEAWREGQLRSLLAGLPPSPLLRGQTSRPLAGGVGASTLPLRDGVTGVTGIVHEACRAFFLHLTSCLCHPSATPSLLGDEPHADPTAGADVTPSQLVQGQKTKQPFLCRCRFTKLV